MLNKLKLYYLYRFGERGYFRLSNGIEFEVNGTGRVIFDIGITKSPKSISLIIKEDSQFVDFLKQFAGLLRVLQKYPEIKREIKDEPDKDYYIKFLWYKSCPYFLINKSKVAFMLYLYYSFVCLAYKNRWLVSVEKQQQLPLLLLLFCEPTMTVETVYKVFYNFFKAFTTFLLNDNLPDFLAEYLMVFVLRENVI